MIEKNAKAIITQNIDSLHKKAESKNVLELDGSVYKNRCTRCGRTFEAEFVFGSDSVSMCECGGIIKFDIVLYDESSNESVARNVIDYISKSDTIFVMGTSLTVYPASAFIKYFKGKKLIIVNSDKTSYYDLASIVIHDKIGKVISEVMSDLSF